ncbi:hypothetical protein F5B20DRAFT_191376 [Whalleya microplaca]|nr:hypothetical protein F5B20DRAFT_191376 [Whalleya microplaca]
MTAPTTGGNKEVLYFAYGSNLSTTQMHQRCPRSTPVGLGHLPGWKWIINERGYANIVQQQPQPQQQQQQQASSPSASATTTTTTAAAGNASAGDPGVYGLLYRLHPDDEATLDACEGVPWAYERRFLDVILVPDKARAKVRAEAGAGAKIEIEGARAHARALVYVDFERVKPSTPRREYVARMNRGIHEAVAEWGLSETYVEDVMRPFLIDE